jgi:hypothetical protein
MRLIGEIFLSKHESLAERKREQMIRQKRERERDEQIRHEGWGLGSCHK